MYEVLQAFGVYSLYDAMSFMNLKEIGKTEFHQRDNQSFRPNQGFLPQAHYVPRINMGRKTRERGSKVR